jgi:FixJ family two-component response regulator
MEHTVPTVFIVEDTHEVSVALTRMLTAAGYQVRCFDSAEHFLCKQDPEAPGCLLVDVCLPGLSGIELQHQLIGSQCARPIVFITGMGDIQTSVHAMKEGAVDFLTKPIDTPSLLAAIEQAFRRDAEQRTNRAIQKILNKRLQTLSKRERQVLEHVIVGRLNKQIAADLGIGEKTIKVHRGRMMSKMAVRSVAELVHLCTSVGLAKGTFSLRRSGRSEYSASSIVHPQQVIGL